MISGISKVAAWSLLGALSLPLPSHATPPEATLDAASLVAGMRRVAPARTAYAEVRFSGLLERPLILHGELEYLGPGQLGKRVDTPYKEQLKVANGEASVQRGSRPPRVFPLGQAPELEGFLRGFAALLGGDADALARDFSLAASGDAHAWQLVLKPRDARLAKRVVAIIVDGSGTTPHCFRTQDADGDLGVLLVDHLAEAKLAVQVSQSQVDALCRGIDPK